MRILIAENNPKYIQVAKNASLQFPEHDFRFTQSAGEAFDGLSENDGLLTDLFFPQTDHPQLNEAYRLYLGCLVEDRNSPPGSVLNEVIRGKFLGEYAFAYDRLRDTLRQLLNARDTWMVEEVMCNGVQALPDPDYFYNPQAERLELPLGCPLVCEADELQRHHVLIASSHATSLRTFAGEPVEPETKVDGIFVLLPLVKKQLMTLQQAASDGEGSLSYLGYNRLQSWSWLEDEGFQSVVDTGSFFQKPQILRDSPKKYLGPWKKAITLLIQQNENR